MQTLHRREILRGGLALLLAGAALPLLAETPRRSRRRLTPTSWRDPGPFTSLIVDCRGLGVEGVISPKLYDQDGREVYGTMAVDFDFALEDGIVAYPRSVDAALSSPRAGERPLVVSAIGVWDRMRDGPVLGRSDARFVRDANRRDRFFERCRVLFLVDPIR